MRGGPLLLTIGQLFKRAVLSSVFTLEPSEQERFEERVPSIPPKGDKDHECEELLAGGMTMIGYRNVSDKRHKSGDRLSVGHAANNYRGHDQKNTVKNRGQQIRADLTKIGFPSSLRGFPLRVFTQPGIAITVWRSTQESVVVLVQGLASNVPGGHLSAATAKRTLGVVVWSCVTSNSSGRIRQCLLHLAQGSTHLLVIAATPWKIYVEYHFAFVKAKYSLLDSPWTVKVFWLPFMTMTSDVSSKSCISDCFRILQDVFTVELPEEYLLFALLSLKTLSFFPELEPYL
ncbi:hypothetical protein Tco_0799181 [Tanacetum coccineum]